jgi:hypothetical protein
MGISTYQISDNFESLQKHDDFTHKIAAQIFQSFGTVAASCTDSTRKPWAIGQTLLQAQCVKRQSQEGTSMLLQSYKASLYERNNFSY